MVSDNQAIEAAVSTFVFEFPMDEGEEMEEEIIEVELPKYMSVIIKEITSLGQMDLEFDDLVSDTFNVSMINGTFLEMYIVPALNRQDDNGFDVKSVNFTWKCVSVKGNIMSFKFNFTIPFEISPLTVQDTMHFFIKDEGIPLFTSKNKKILDPSKRFLKKKVPK